MIKGLRVRHLPAAIGLLGLPLWGCNNSMNEINALVNKTKAQEDRGLDVTVIYSRGGRVEARLFARELIRNESARPAYTDMKNGLKVEFFDDSARVTSTLTARYARWYVDAGNILIRDSIVIITRKGERLETDELVWNKSIQKFFTEKPVRITTPTHVLSGRGMEANQDFSQYSITGGITGAVRVDKGAVPGE